MGSGAKSGDLNRGANLVSEVSILNSSASFFSAFCFLFLVVGILSSIISNSSSACFLTESSSNLSQGKVSYSFTR